MDRIALVTYEGAPDLSEDDRLLLTPLKKNNIQADAAVWDDPAVRWEEFDALILRSCWDYHRRSDEFLRWIADRELEKAALWNPPGLVRWNHHKGYLELFAEAGVRVASTVHLDRGSRVGLAELMERQEWTDAVIKPAISASAYRTCLASRATAAVYQNEFEDLLEGAGMMVQEFLPEIRTEGEWSFVFLGEDFSHAVLKRPRKGDFRVQEELGGTVTGNKPPGSLIDQARRVARSVPGPFLYARVDGVARGGNLVVMEVELIEPSLFLGFASGAPDRFANKIVEILRRRTAVRNTPKEKTD